MTLFCRPKLRFGDYMALTDDSESVEPKLILKRKEADSIDKVWKCYKYVFVTIFTHSLKLP